LIRADIALGNEPNITVEIDELIADFGGDEGLPDVILGIGGAYYRQGRYREKAGDIDGRNAYYRDAISVYERLTAEFGDSEDAASAYYFSALCYELIGGYEIAIQYYQKVVDDWPDDIRSPRLLYRITKLYAKLEGSGQISTMDASIEIRQACKKLLEDYPASRYVDEMRKTLEHWNLIYAWLLSQQK